MQLQSEKRYLWTKWYYPLKQVTAISVRWWYPNWRPLKSAHCLLEVYEGMNEQTWRPQNVDDDKNVEK